ncbi:MAG: epoxyqueuosine reductase [Candidatus Competibacteraceae bacterium]|nr:epoxyqueuosine reductase [Candidatus Competibacteraceae bacterium]
MNKKSNNTQHISRLLKEHNIDVFGVADLKQLSSAELPLHVEFGDIYKNYKYAIVAGIQFGKYDLSFTSTNMILELEKSAYKILEYCEENKNTCLIIHPEDEFDPIERKGFLSLKVLAKYAGLGWQGHSLLIISPQFGPLHRIIAVLTNMELCTNETIESKCGDCRECITKCPRKALTFKSIIDQSSERNEILDISACLGDEGCTVCMKVCSRTKNHLSIAST